MWRKLRDNGLSIVVFSIFFFTLIGQVIAGYQVYNEERHDHHLSHLNYNQYFATGHFVEAIFENWESEFLQMGAYIVLTACLFQKGSAESKDPDKEENDTEDKLVPVSHRMGRSGLAKKLYENSLSLALLTLFLVSFFLHAAGGAKLYSEEQVAQGESPVSLVQYLGTAQFWFESFQNWQSEFFSIGVIVVLSIWLRQKGSPQSKSMSAPDSQTGD